MHIYFAEPHADGAVEQDFLDQIFNRQNVCKVFKITPTTL